jgi:ribosomal protein L32
MKIPKRIKVFEDIENRGYYIVEGANSPEEALKYLALEYPETKDIFKAEQGKSVRMYKCLDCESYWISEDVCGECGEYRLSKKSRQAYYFTI